MNFNFKILHNHTMDSMERSTNDTHYIAFIASSYGSQPRGAYYDKSLDCIMYIIPKAWETWFPGYQEKKVEFNANADTYHDLIRYSGHLKNMAKEKL